MVSGGEAKRLPHSVFIPEFTISYEGGYADHHVLIAQKLGRSIVGASKLYDAVAHYVYFGNVSRGRYKKRFNCYAKVPRPGSYEYSVYIAAIAAEYSIHADVYNKAASFLFSN